jgi:GNAT superfamily N-acetyltransferase
MNLTVRSAQPGDGEIVWRFAKELAELHKEGHLFHATPGDFEKALFEQGSVCNCEIAEVDNEPAGHAFWHRSFSTFRGKPCIYLEDVFVTQKYRRMGIALALFKHLAQIAQAQDYASIYWLMMEWNAGARDFYQSIGAEFEKGFFFYRLHGDSLRKLAAK